VFADNSATCLNVDCSVHIMVLRIVDNDMHIFCDMLYDTKLLLLLH